MPQALANALAGLAHDFSAGPWQLDQIMTRGRPLRRTVVVVAATVTLRAVDVLVGTTVTFGAVTVAVVVASVTLMAVAIVVVAVTIRALGVFKAFSSVVGVGWTRMRLSVLALPCLCWRWKQVLSLDRHLAHHTWV